MKAFILAILAAFPALGFALAPAAPTGLGFVPPPPPLVSHGVENPVWSCMSTPDPDIEVVISQDDLGDYWGEYYTGVVNPSVNPMSYAPRYAANIASSGGVTTYTGKSITQFPLIGNSNQNTQIVPMAVLTLGNPTIFDIAGTSYTVTCTNPMTPPRLIPVTTADCAPNPGPPTSVGTIQAPAPMGTGHCDDTSQPFGFSTSAYTGRDDTSNIQTAMNQGAKNNETVVLAAGHYCITSPLNYKSQLIMTGAGAGMASTATFLEVPAAIIWSNWCNAEAANGISSVNGVSLTCPNGGTLSSFQGNFALQPNTVNVQQVIISSLTVYGHADTFYAASGAFYDYYQWANNGGLTVDNNCNGGNSNNAGWVSGPAGGIQLGNYTIIQYVEVIATVAHAYQDRQSGSTIQYSISDGVVCSDGIGGSGSSIPKAGNSKGQPFLLGDEMAGCPGANVLHHTWLPTFHSASSAMDIEDTVGVVLAYSTNSSDNHVTFEGVRDSTIEYNVFNGGGQIIVHPNDEYVYNDYRTSGGVEFESSTKPSFNWVINNMLSNGSAIHADFEPADFRVPWVQGTHVAQASPAAPYNAGPTVITGNTITGSLQSGIEWNAGSPVGMVSAYGTIANNTISNAVTCPTPVQNPAPGSIGALCNSQLGNVPYLWNQSGISVYNGGDSTLLTVNVTNNTIKPTANMLCGIQGDFTNAPSGNSNGSGTCGYNPEGFNCGVGNFNQNQMVCTVPY